MHNSAFSVGGSGSKVIGIGIFHQIFKRDPSSKYLVPGVRNGLDLKLGSYYPSFRILFYEKFSLTTVKLAICKLQS